MDLIRRRAAIVLFLCLCAAGPLFSVWRVHDWGNRLSTVDPYSEANVLREVRHFIEEGPTRYYGLGKVYYPGMYPTEGFAAEPDVSKFGVSVEGIYTHYPPGPEYLAYAAAELFGPEPVSRLRLFPIMLGWAAMTFFGLAIRQRFGAAAGWLVLGACTITPTVTDGFVSLHSQGYALALLLFEIGLTIGGKARLLPFALLGFLQGWLSFDYVFLVTFTPLALELVMPRVDPVYRPDWKRAVSRTILAGGGFAAAHVLHFFQISAYWGTFSAAAGDLAGAAAHRAGMETTHGPFSYLTQAVANSGYYFYGLHPFSAALSPPDPDNIADWSMFRFLGLSLGPWWLLVTVALMIWSHLNPKSPAASLRTGWHVVSAAGMAVTSLWLVVMVNHGLAHRHFLYRHQFLMFFFMILFASVTAHRLWVAADMSARWLNRSRIVAVSRSGSPP